MKKLFLTILCAAFALVGCDESMLNGIPTPDNTDTTETPVFVVDADGDYIIPAAGATIEVIVATNLEYTLSIPNDAKSWVSLTNTRSIRSEILTFTIAQNLATQARTANVELLDKDGNVLETLVFKQDAAAGENPGDEPEDPNDNQNQNPSEITLSADKTSAEVGDVVTFTVTDGTGKNVTASSTIYDMDYSVVKNAKYKTTKEGTFKFFATRNGYTSNTLTVKVGDGGSDEPGQTEGTAFLHKVLVIDHTGVNCGYCPNAIDNLRNLESKTTWGPYYNEVSCHAGSYASGDPASSEAATALNTFQGNNGLINGYPTIAVNFYNRASSYSYSNIANALQNVVKKSGADVGISLSVEKGTSKVICSAQIKAAVSNEYKVNAWLLENNIYSPNQAGKNLQDYHYYYNHALRKTSETFNAGDISGKSIGMLYIGETYDYNCEISVDSTWEINNLEVLIVVAARNGSNQWEVVNSAVCGVGETTPFAYVD